MDFLNDFVGWANNILWGPVMIYGILIVGLFFSILTKFAQVRLIKDMFILMFKGEKSDLWRIFIPGHVDCSVGSCRYR